MNKNKLRNTARQWLFGVLLLVTGLAGLHDRPPGPVHSTRIAILDRPNRGCRQRRGE